MYLVGMRLYLNLSPYNEAYQSTAEQVISGVSVSRIVSLLDMHQALCLLSLSLWFNSDTDYWSLIFTSSIVLLEAYKAELKHHSVGQRVKLCLHNRMARPLERSTVRVRWLKIKHPHASTYIHTWNWRGYESAASAESRRRRAKVRENADDVPLTCS